MIDENVKDESIDKILEKIKKAMEKNPANSSFHREEDVIELTDIVDNENDLSDRREEKSSPTNPLFSDPEVKEAFKHALKPYLKSWLNANLPSIAKEIVEKEIRLMFSKV